MFLQRTAWKARVLQKTWKQSDHLIWKYIFFCGLYLRIKEITQRKAMLYGKDAHFYVISNDD